MGKSGVAPVPGKFHHSYLQFFIPSWKSVILFEVAKKITDLYPWWLDYILYIWHKHE